MEDTEEMFNVTTIIRMVIMTVETGIATVGIDDKKDQEEKNWDKITSITTGRNNGNKRVLKEETDDVSAPVAVIGIKTDVGAQDKRVEGSFCHN